MFNSVANDVSAFSCGLIIVNVPGLCLICRGSKFDFILFFARNSMMSHLTAHVPVNSVFKISRFIFRISQSDWN